MKMADESRVDRRRLELGLVAVVFLGLLVYAWRGIQSHLLYYGFGVFTACPVFSWEGPFLQTTFSAPGGVLNALAALLTQTYRSSSLGALVIVAVLGALFAGMRRLLHSIQANKLRDLAWVPVIVALVIYGRCDDPLAVLLAMNLSVWMAVLYHSIAIKTLATRVGVLLALFAAMYYLLGGSAFIFACIVCLTELLWYRRATVALIQAVLACGGTLLLGRLVFDLPPRAAYTVGTFWDLAHRHEFSTLSNVLTIALHAFLPGVILLSSLGRILLPSGKGAKRARNDGQAGRWRADGRLGIGVRILAVVLTASLCLVFSRNHIRDERMLNYHARQRDWDRVIALAHRMRGRRAFTRSGVFDINRALAHQGLLGEELCAYPQDETRTLFLSFDDMTGRLQHAKLLELYLDLGCPNAAEKNAYELLDNEGPSPYVLETLVRIHLAKGQYESAGIAFRAMRKYVGCREYVRKWEDIITDPARAEGNPLIHTWRQAKGSVDYAVGGIAFESMLKRLLQDTPDHRVAFEYLMAYYLLKHQRAELVGCLPLLGPLGYNELPRHYAEAMLVHSLETKTPVDPRGWTIPADVQSQFRETADVVKNARGDNQAVFDTLAPKYGDTYTFYSMFNVCGVK
ncbi:MAG: DUF6057 family protein [Phycisphaerales bacterium]